MPRGSRPRPVRCIFDNTASAAATADALKLQRLLGLPALEAQEAVTPS
jgi:hypothetical protein